MFIFTQIHYERMNLRYAIDGWMYVWMDGCMDGWMYGCMDGCM
jgi:hypothetical protein